MTTSFYEEKELPISQLNDDIFPAPEGVFYTAFTHDGKLNGWYCIRVEEGGRDIQVRVTVLNGKLVSARKYVFPAVVLPSAEDLDRTVDGESPLVPVQVRSEQD